MSTACEPPRGTLIRIEVLGGVRLLRDGAVVTGRATQPYHVALMAFLAASPGQCATRDKLVALFWPERDSRRARHRLSVALHVLRSDVGEDPFVTSGESVGLDAAVVWTDLGAFLSAVEAGRIEEAAGLYAGPFLDGFFLTACPDFDPWVEAERARIGLQYRAVLERLIADAEGGRGSASAVT